MKSSKIEVDIVSNTDILLMLLLPIIIMMIILLLVLLLLLLLLLPLEKVIKVVKKWLCIKKKLKLAIDIVRLIFYSVKKMLLNSVFISVKVISCF